MQEYDHYDKSEILEKALEHLITKSKTKGNEPNLYAPSDVLSAYLKSIRPNRMAWSACSDAIMAWETEHNRVDKMIIEE